MPPLHRLKSPFLKPLLLAVLLAPGLVRAEPAFNGHSGLINMPDGRIAPEGTLGLGFLRSEPYTSGWAAISLFPWLESTVRFSEVDRVPAFGERTGYGDYKDKSIGLKLRLLDEQEWRPSVSVGIDDFITDTPRGLFRSNYLAASKQVGAFDFTLGLGHRRIDGLYGGLRYRPSRYPNFALVAEYDAIDYRNDFRAQVSEVADRKKAVNFGVEYQWRWMAAQLSYQQDHFAINTYVQVPLQRREWEPKVHEPPPYAKVMPRPTGEQWDSEPVFRRRVVDALLSQDFRNVRLRYDNYQLEAILTNSRISQVSRAIGRAARVLSLLGPTDMRQIRITYTVRDLPIATYTFFDLDKLARYFEGRINRQQFAEYVLIEHPNPGEYKAAREQSEQLEGFAQAGAGVRLAVQEEGQFIALKGEDALLNQVRVRPAINTFLNDASKPFQYDFYLSGSWNRYLGDATYAHVLGRLTLSENLSDEIQPSNSQLPHVRSDVANYKRGGRFKLDRALLNKFFHPRERVYARASAGLYEEMFGGVGGQVLYLPHHARWGVDVSADWVKQRDVKGWFGFSDYSTLTALASLNYKLPLQLTGTLRAGRFLAKDNGVRFEFKRTFVSGVEVGAWYTVTDGNDITSPGSPSSPYRDKGVFITIPMNIMLTRDTQSIAGFGIAPWTRDVGQMVASPADLYAVLERPLVRDVRTWDGLTRFGDRYDDYAMPSEAQGLLERDLLSELGQDARDGIALLGSGRTWRAVGIGAALAALSAPFDERIDRWVVRSGNRERWRQLDKAGKLLPIAGLGLAGLAALQEHDGRLANTGFSALQAGAIAGLASIGVKQLVGRARPLAGRGHAEFGIQDKAESSFPSNHAAVAWAVATPFAREYDAPWLYGAALLTSAGRIGARQHWLSDTVASGLIGYGIGSVLWSWHRDPKRGDVSLHVSPDGVSVSKQF